MPAAHLNGTTIAFEDIGRGEPVVLVHGAWVDHRNWGAVVPRLSESLRVVTYSLRGHGDSRLEDPDSGTVHDDLDDLLALSDHLGLETITVGGISSGACIALRFASAHPARARRVFAHEPPCFEYVVGDEKLGPTLTEFGGVIAQVLQRIEAGANRGAAEQFFSLFYPWEELSREEQDSIASHARAFLGQNRDPDAIVLEPAAMRRVTAPALLSTGDESPPFASRIVDELARVVPNAHRYTFPKAGHVPQMTHPDEYVEMVVDFVRST